VSVHSTEKTQIKFANNSIVVSKTWCDTALRVFINYKKRLVSTSLENFTVPAANKLVTRIIKFADSSAPKDDYFGIAKGPFKYKSIQGTYDSKIAGLSDKSIDLVESGINSALSEGAKRCAGVLEFANNSVHLLTSSNVDVKDKTTGIYFSIRAFLDSQASGYSNLVATKLAGFNTAKAGMKAGEIAVLAKNPEKLKPGKYDLIIDPYPFASFLDYFGSSASVHSVESGWSFLGNKIGKPVASENITLYDDSALPGALGSMKFDAEGMPSQRTLVVDKGLLKTYLHNTSTAKKYKTKTTANAGLISPDPSNIVLKPGKLSSGSLYKGFNGLRITNTWYTRFQNYLTGDFSSIPRDGIFLIKDGEIVESVKDIRISDNMINLFKSIKATTKEQKQNSGWEVETPVTCGSAVASGINITTSTK
ncbi:TldD/PmbA family protein, partial [Candidatus Woesearchaeota archaeon]|nr:TldD/PmbA family protein [Candidatus Woesearchaeota archaeon]